MLYRTQVEGSFINEITEKDERNIIKMLNPDCDYGED